MVHWAAFTLVMVQMNVACSAGTVMSRLVQVGQLPTGVWARLQVPAPQAALTRQRVLGALEQRPTVSTQLIDEA